MDPMFMGLCHIALNVRDVRKSLQFYSSVLGMQLEWMPDEDNAYLTSGSDNLALHKLAGGAEPGQVQTLHHIGFVVRTPGDVDAWADRVRGHGIQLAAEPRTHRDGARSFYFHDPDGILIQLIYHPPISDRE
jgi:catechol 2,3-dioxygenase-like lactoylglutathione lyase family enzyme